MAQGNYRNPAEAAVCARANEVPGEKVCACLVPAPGAEVPSLEDVQAFLTAKGLAQIKLPQRLEILTALPRNPLGKVQRFVLQEQVAALPAGPQ